MPDTCRHNRQLASSFSDQVTKDAWSRASDSVNRTYLITVPFSAESLLSCAPEASALERVTENHAIIRGRNHICIAMLMRSCYLVFAHLLSRVVYHPCIVSSPKEWVWIRIGFPRRCRDAFGRRHPLFCFVWFYEVCRPRTLSLCTHWVHTGYFQYPRALHHRRIWVGCGASV